MFESGAAVRKIFNVTGPAAAPDHIQRFISAGPVAEVIRRVICFWVQY